MCDSFFFNDTATTEIYTLSLHDALPIFEALSFGGMTTFLTPSSRANTPACAGPAPPNAKSTKSRGSNPFSTVILRMMSARSEEHTSELQSRRDLVCRLLLEKKKQHNTLR